MRTATKELLRPALTGRLTTQGSAPKTQPSSTRLVSGASRSPTSDPGAFRLTIAAFFHTLHGRTLSGFSEWLVDGGPASPATRVEAGFAHIDLRALLGGGGRERSIDGAAESDFRNVAVRFELLKSIAIVEQLHNKRMLRRLTERYATITLLLGSDYQLYNAGEFGFTAVDNEHEIESAQYLSKVDFLPHVESIDSSALSVTPSTRLVLDSAQAPEPGRFTVPFDAPYS